MIAFHSNILKNYLLVINRIAHSYSWFKKYFKNATKCQESVWGWYVNLINNPPFLQFS